MEVQFQMLTLVECVVFTATTTTATTTATTTTTPAKPSKCRHSRSQRLSITHMLPPTSQHYVELTQVCMGPLTYTLYIIYVYAMHRLFCHPPQFHARPRALHCNRNAVTAYVKVHTHTHAHTYHVLTTPTTAAMSKKGTATTTSTPMDGSTPAITSP